MIFDRQKQIRAIKETLEEIDYWFRNQNWEELPNEEIKELDLLTGKLWLFFFYRVKK